MCGIGGAFDLGRKKIPSLKKRLGVINDLQIHRGPDGSGTWTNHKDSAGFAHRRLSIIDLESGSQPMHDDCGNSITYNGEVYNYIELKNDLKDYKFKTESDTEVILTAYSKWGEDCVHRFDGMFAFAIWDKKSESLFCARDPFGIKPFYYTIVGGVFYFSSEIKALLPFVNNIETDANSLQEYLTFQFTLGEKTLFSGIKQLMPGHRLVIKGGVVNIDKYWEVFYDIDYSHTESFFVEKLDHLLNKSSLLHMRSDTPVGSYLSGGIDSGIVASMASNISNHKIMSFCGRFPIGNKYDESSYARSIADKNNLDLRIVDIDHNDFINNINKVIYHLDSPVAGPGSFSQFMVSKFASNHRKTVLGGQGGDEIFGGYTRYLIAYFEQCIKAAIDGSLDSGNFIVTYKSIIPNLKSLRAYKPLIKQFWSDGLFDDMDKRYYSLVNRSSSLEDQIDWKVFGGSTYETFRDIFYGDNVGHKSYFDLMTHFDFKTLLPALLQVEDRVSMAHGLESRVPLLDKDLVRFVATIPSNIKFKNGALKGLLVNSSKKYLPREVVSRKDKMGFPTPFNIWSSDELSELISDTFSSKKAQERPYLKNGSVLNERDASSGEFGRGLWGLLSLEIWQQEFHDNHNKFKGLI
tara:strand:+ start:87888 stop:89789 length:1902 start_codon:yes stop_codon:yes gene_type:complete